MNLDKVFENNQKWIAQKLEKNPDYFHHLSQGQNPDILYIGCSDSRVTAEDHVVVCGHYFCGGVKAAMQAQDLGILNPWLRNIRDVYRLHKKELSAISDENARYNRLVELNVQEQCVNLLKTAAVQDAIKHRNLQVHGWVFDIQTGKLIDLKLDVNHLLKDIMEIYDLGD